MTADCSCREYWVVRFVDMVLPLWDMTVPLQGQQRIEFLLPNSLIARKTF